MDLGAAMGALLLGRQLGGALALAAAETIYVGRLHAGDSTEAATGSSIFVVATAGAFVAALALLTLRRGADHKPRGLHPDPRRRRPSPRDHPYDLVSIGPRNCVASGVSGSAELGVDDESHSHAWSQLLSVAPRALRRRVARASNEPALRELRRRLRAATRLSAA